MATRQVGRGHLPWKAPVAGLILALAASTFFLLAPTIAGQSAVLTVGPGSASPSATAIRTSQSTLLESQGNGVLVVLAVPVALCAVGALVRRRWVLLPIAVLLTAFSILGAASIGLFFLPAAVAMGLAAAESLESRQRRR